MKSLLLLSVLTAGIAAQVSAAKHRIFLVSSYHREYLWDQELHSGTCAGLIEGGALKSQAHCETLAKKDFVETPTAVVKKAWMDTKRKSSKKQMVATAAALKVEIDAFKPDVIIVSDDNGTNYIGNHYKGSKIPVVFCGVDETPVKYGLVESAQRPGHNITGVYQRGYYKDAAVALLKLKPGLKTFGILADGSESAKAKVMGIQQDAADAGFPLRLAGTVQTDSFTEFKKKTLELARKVDAMLVVNHNTLKDDAGKPVDQMEVGSWYLKNVKKPDFSSEKQFVQEGLLVVAEDSAHRQALAAVKMAFRILKRGDKPATMATLRPPRGPIIVNRQRAEMLGLKVDGKADEFIATAKALETASTAAR